MMIVTTTNPDRDHFVKLFMKAKETILTKHLVKDRDMPGLWWPKTPMVLRPTVLEDEVELAPQVTVPLEVRSVDADGHVTVRFIRDNLRPATPAKTDDWTAKTMARLDELAKRLEV